MVDFTKLFQVQEQAESGGNPDAVSHKGAWGPMQLMEATGKQPGYGVPPLVDRSHAENRRVGQGLMTAFVNEYGNVPDALAAYNWGPGNVNKWKASGADPAKLPKETSDYIAKITSQLGESPAGAGRGSVNPVMPTPQGIPDRRAQYDAMVNQVFQRGIVKETSDVEKESVAASVNAVALSREEARPSALEMVGAAMAGSTGNKILDAIMRPKFEYEPGWVPDGAMLPAGTDKALQENFFNSRSAAEAKDAIQRWKEEQFRLKTVMNRGAAIGIALSLGGEIVDPINWIVPWAAAKGLARVGAGSEVLMAAGRTGAGYGSAVGENLVSGAALEAVKQSLEGEFKPADLGISILADAFIGLGSGYLSARGALSATTAKASASALARETDLATRAEKRLGTSATPEEVRAEMDVVRREDANATITTALADVPDAEKLIAPWVRPAWPTPERRTVIGSEEYPNLPAKELSDTGTGVRQRAAPDTPEFKAAFGDTRVLGEDGQPLIVYHQTLADIESFDPALRGSNTGAQSAKEAFFFSASTRTTDAYGQNRAGANVVPVYVSMKNPLVYDFKGVKDRKVKFTDLIDQAKAQGHDGVIFKNGYDGGPLDTVYAAFDNKQIKSAIGNRGTFDMTDPRINYAPTKDATAPKERVVISEAPVKAALEQALTSPAILNEMSPDSRGARTLISHLLNILPEEVLKGKVNFTGYGSRGSFNPIDGVLDSPGRAAADLMPQAGKMPNEAVILAHEVVHAATAKMIDAVETGAAGVTAEMRKAVGNLAAIRRDLELELKALGKLDKSSNFGANYATKNLHEFVAQVMSDADTRMILATMPAKGFVDKLTEFANAVMRLLGFNPKTGNTALQEAVTLIERVIKEGPPPAVVTRLNGPAPGEVVNELMQDPAYVRFGLTGLPVGTAAERKEAQAILALYKKADAWEIKNPMDDAWKARAKNLADNEVFNVASTGLKMLSSPSPLVRMLANELLEDASGVAGKRRATASIKKHMVERFMLKNSINDVQIAYGYWKKGKPGGFMDDMVGGKNWEAYNKEIASEIEARAKTGGPVSQDPNIKAATDSLEAAYQRIANEQRRVNTLGSEGLATTSVGYMPHRMSAKAFIQLSNAKQQVVHTALVDQFAMKGWDISFSDQLATKYLSLARGRAAGDYGTAMGGHGAASHVEEALRGMDLPEDTITKHMEKFSKGGASHTKGRLELDLNQVHIVDGEEFKLLDIYETNQIELLRGQAGRASGEVALTQFGVRGKPSADMLRRAMQYGEDGKRADRTRDFESYDQMISEFYNEPYGTKTGRWVDRAMAANAAVRLGGIAFNQLAETINGIAHVGVLRSLESIGDIRRLRDEIITLSKGGTVNNSIIGSIEHAGGAEFGTDAYKIVMPFDSPDHAFPTYGQDTLTAADRLLRGAGHVQSMLSGWRAIHSAQQRGMAEQIVHKMMRYVREGKDDIALEQFGVHADIRTALRNELSQIATFNGDRLVSFDVTKISDPDIREQVIQAVWRGTSQIIQGTFIGERGKWAHDGMMKLMTQFRTFSITSMEKQWGRQRNSHGTAAAFGLLMGAMTFAAPIYMARTYLASIGRDDQDKFLEERLSLQMIARATLNYTASSGISGDVMDLLTATMPESLGIKATGGRSGVESDFVGNYIAPASSLVNDIWKYVQSPLELDDALKIMPGSRMPFMVPLVNLARD